MKVIKGLAEGREVTYNGPSSSSRGAEAAASKCGWPATGPRALRLCGEQADGFILQLADPQITEWTIAAVRKAAADAGRDPDELYMCVAAPAYVGDDVAHQRDQVRWFGGMVGNHVADLVGRYGDTGGAVPQALTDYIKGRQGYDYAEQRQGRQRAHRLRARRRDRPLLHPRR